MRNRLLDITKRGIPYLKELRPCAGSVTACVLMQQLDHRFAKYPDGFYKFLEPCAHDLCKQDDTWQEELGMSADEFRTAFDKIGIRYKSKGDYDKQGDPFDGKFYCSYHDKRRGTTQYFRNHDLVDALLDAISEGRNAPEEECRDRSGFVYLAEAVGSGRWKIGCSRKPIQRDETLKRQSPYPLVVKALLRSENPEGLEAFLHDHYADKRVHGEWFELTVEDVSKVEAMGVAL